MIQIKSCILASVHPTGVLLRNELNTMQYDLSDRYRQCRDVIEYLNQYQFLCGVAHASNAVAKNQCVESIDLLRTHLTEVAEHWIKATSSEHWIARALLDSLLGEFNKLLSQLDLLLITVDETEDLEPSFGQVSHKNLSIQIATLQERVVTALKLEQQIVPSLLAMGEITPLEHQPVAHQTLH